MLRRAFPVLWLSMTAAAAAGWPFEREYPPFQVHGDFPLERMDPLLRELVRLQQEIRQGLELRPSSEIIEIYLFSNSDIYHSYMRRHFPQVTPRRAMFIKSNSPGNVFAFAGPDLAVDLRHESTHAILHASLPLVPLWLDEGLAEYFEVPAARRAFGHEHMVATRRGVLWGRPPDLQRLEALTDLSQMGAREYQEAWAWVHFLLHGPPSARDTLRSYLQDVSRGIPPQPISRRLAEKTPRAEREFVSHFKRWQK